MRLVKIPHKYDLFKHYRKTFRVDTTHTGGWEGRHSVFDLCTTHFAPGPCPCGEYWVEVEGVVSR